MNGCNECNKWRQKHNHIFTDVRKQNARIEEQAEEIAELREQHTLCVEKHTSYTKRIAELEAIIKDAQHAAGCGWWYGKPCDCWKLKALKEQG